MKLVSLLRTLLVVAVLAPWASAQHLPQSGIAGYWFFHASSPTGTSQLFAVNPDRSDLAIPLGNPVASVPSRWAHRRRTLGGTETELISPTPRLWITPMGDAPGQGALHVVDRRSGVAWDALIPTQNPAAYDLAALPELRFLFSVEESDAGQTVLRGWSYGTLGALQPLNPAALTLPGPPSAYVNRIEVDEVERRLHIVGSDTISIVQIQTSSPQMNVAVSLPLGNQKAVTNASRFEWSGGRAWMVGTSSFASGSTTVEAGVQAWSDSGSLGQVTFGDVPTNPAKQWVPAAGTSELAIVSDNTDAYGYFLLREPAPGTFFIKPSAIGVAKLVSGGTLQGSTILMPETVGEPFAIPAAHGTRVAFESSFGPPFIQSPPGGGEKISVLYSPLDPLGAGSPDGVLGVPAPLGGRISTKGMDRPIWSSDGRRVLACTSHFPGAPNPGVPGIEVLEVPAGVLLDEFAAPHRVVENLPFPNQSVIQPGAFRPRVPAAALGLGSMDFYGNGFAQGSASVALASWGEVGQLREEAAGLPLSPHVPGFPGLLPPAFHDPTGSLTPVPESFGARRASFCLNLSLGLRGMRMLIADEDRVIVQFSGQGVLAELGLEPVEEPLSIDLPSGWVVTTEFYSF